MKNKKLLEHGKTALIVLLLISSVVLLEQTGYYSAAFDKIGSFFVNSSYSSRNSESTVMGSGILGMAQPKGVSVCVEGGGRYASLYNKEQVEEDYGRFSAFVAEALGSAGEVYEADASQWFSALSRKSVYICYHSPQSFNSLSRLLGTTPGASIAGYSSEELCLSIDDGVGKLFFLSGDKYFALETSVSVSALEERISEYVPNKSIFSHEDRLLYGVGDNFLIIKNLSQAPVIKSSVPSMESLVAPMMKVLNINEYTASAYIEGNGTSVYVDSDSILRISSSGTVRYELSGAEGVRAAADGNDERAQLSWEILNSTIIPEAGKAEIYLSSISKTEDGHFVLCFDYLAAGIPVSIGGRHAAEFVFDRDLLISAEFFARGFTVEQEVQQLLPMYQAAAIASSARSNNMKLMYVDSAEGLSCIWVDE